MKSPWYSHGFFMALTMDPPWSSMGTGPLIFHGKPMEYFCKGYTQGQKLKTLVVLMRVNLMMCLF